MIRYGRRFLDPNDSQVAVPFPYAAQKGCLKKNSLEEAPFLSREMGLIWLLPSGPEMD